DGIRVLIVTGVQTCALPISGASMLLTALIALQRAPTPFDTAQVLAVNVPVMRGGNRTPAETRAFYQDVVRQVGQLPGVERASVGSTVPWRDAGNMVTAQFTVEGYAKEGGEEDPRARLRFASPGFFATLGMRLI